MSLVTIAVYKYSDVWHDMPAWRNLYTCEFSGGSDALENLAQSFIEAERTIHQSHVVFMFATANFILSDNQNRFGDDGSEDVLNRELCRIGLPAVGNQRGLTLTDYDVTPQLTLIVAHSVERGRRGANFYRGCLRLSDCKFGDGNTVALSNVAPWHDVLNTSFKDALLIPHTNLRVRHLDSAAPDGVRFEPVQRILAHSACYQNATTRNKSGVPSWRSIVPELCDQFLREMRLELSNIQDAAAVRHPFYDESVRNSALRIMALSFVISRAVYECIYKDSGGTLTQDITMSTRSGPTSGELIGFASIAAKYENLSVLHSEAWNSNNAELSSLARETSIAGHSYFSPEDFEKIYGWALKYYRACEQIARGDYIQPVPYVR